MGRRITLYEAALSEAEATGGDTARQAAIAAFAKADSMFRLIHRVRAYIASAFGFVALLVVVAIIVDWGFHGFMRDYWNSELPNTAMVRATAFFGVAFACYSLWDIALLFEKFGIIPGRLKAPALASFQVVRERCPNAAPAAFEHDGKDVDGPIFESFWSLILFSRYPAHRRFQLPHANGIIEGQPLVEAPVSGEVIVFDPSVAPTRETPTINATINLSSTTNTLNVQNTYHAPPVPKRRTKPEKPHWYSSVSAERHSERSVKIANHWNGSETDQVKTALDTAFAKTREGQSPNISRGDLVDEIVEVLKTANLKVGLGKTSSKEWIVKMFGEGERHDYTWVRRYLTEPDFEPPYELPSRNSACRYAYAQLRVNVSRLNLSRTSAILSAQPCAERSAMQSLESNNLLTMKQVMNLAGFKSRTTVYRRLELNCMPQPCQIGLGRRCRRNRRFPARSISTGRLFMNWVIGLAIPRVWPAHSAGGLAILPIRAKNCAPS